MRAIRHLRALQAIINRYKGNGSVQGARQAIGMLLLEDTILGTRARPGILLPGAALLLSLVFFVAVFAFTEPQEATSGKIIGIDKSSRESCLLSITYEAEGRLFQSQVPSTTLCQQKAGSSVEVFYRKGNPAQLKSSSGGGALRAAALVLLVLGAGFFLSQVLILLLGGWWIFQGRGFSGPSRLTASVRAEGLAVLFGEEVPPVFEPKR